MPVRAQSDDLVVKARADPPAHADDESFTGHRRCAVLEMFDEVLGNGTQPLIRANNGFNSRPPRVKAPPRAILLLISNLFDFLVQRCALLRIEPKLNQAALVVDRHSCAIVHRLRDVINIDVVAEDLPSNPVARLDRRSRETDKRSVGQSVTDVPREAVDKVVLAAMRLVGYHHDVSALRKCWIGVAPVSDAELLKRREDYPARFYVEKLLEVLTRLSLSW